MNFKACCLSYMLSPALLFPAMTQSQLLLLPDSWSLLSLGRMEVMEGTLMGLLKTDADNHGASWHLDP